MYDVVAAIQSKFAADGTLAAEITGGIYLARAPSGTAMPYAVLTPLASTSPSYSTGTPYTQDVGIQLSVYATPPEEAARLGQLLRDAFHRQSLPMASGRCLAAAIAAERFMVDPEPDASGNDVGHYSTDFLFTQEQNHP